MTIAIAFALAFFLLAVSQVANDLYAPPLERPLWTANPTLGNALFAGATWFIRPFLEAYSNSGSWFRSIVFGMLALLLELAIPTAMFLGAISAVAAYIDSTALQVILVAVTFLLGGPIVLKISPFIMLLPALLGGCILRSLLSSRSSQNLPQAEGRHETAGGSADPERSNEFGTRSARRDSPQPPPMPERRTGGILERWPILVPLVVIAAFVVDALLEWPLEFREWLEWGTRTLAAFCVCGYFSHPRASLAAKWAWLGGAAVFILVDLFLNPPLWPWIWHGKWSS